MSTLFIDTSYNQILGLLNEEGKPQNFKISEGQRSSATLHADLNQLCISQSVKPNHLKQVMYVAGPGFYTGLRLSYGMAEMIGLDGAVSKNFYTYEVPSFLGKNHYTWVTKAYRGEVFVYQRTPSGELIKLYSEKEFLSRNWDGDIYIHHQNALDELMAAKLPGAIATQDLMINNLSVIYEAVKNRLNNLPLYYFRPPEEEFKPNP